MSILFRPLMLASTANPAQPLDRHNWSHPAKMPTRFGVGVMLLFLTLFSVSFFLLGALEVPPVLILFLTLLFTAVGCGQIFWPHKPRLASTLAGTIFVPLWCVGFVALEMSPDRRLFSVAALFWVGLCGIPLGTLFGYLAGTLLAGIFLKAGFRGAAPTDVLSPEDRESAAAVPAVSTPESLPQEPR